MSSFPFAPLGENQALECGGPTVYGSVAALMCKIQLAFFTMVIIFAV